MPPSWPVLQRQRAEGTWATSVFFTSIRQKAGCSLAQPPSLPGPCGRGVHTQSCTGPEHRVLSGQAFPSVAQGKSSCVLRPQASPSPCAQPGSVASQIPVVVSFVFPPTWWRFCKSDPFPLPPAKLHRHSWLLSVE